MIHGTPPEFEDWNDMKISSYIVIIAYRGVDVNSPNLTSAMGPSGASVGLSP
jgi:hypothetical protein